MELSKRHKQCLEALQSLESATAREVAVYMYDNGYTNILERNIAHPRLNELENEGYVERIDKKIDELTKKEVYIYIK